MKKTSRGETLNKRNRVESVDRDRLEDDRAIRSLVWKPAKLSEAAKAFYGVEDMLHRLAELAARGSVEPAVMEESLKIVRDGARPRTEEEEVAMVVRSVMTAHPWVPDPSEGERLSHTSTMIGAQGLDGDELCVLLGALLTARGIVCSIAVRKYDGEFVHPVLHWQDYRGAWRAIDPCGGDEATMTAELSVPIRRKP